MKETDTKIISSIVGPKAASAFIHNTSTRKILTGRDILSGFDRQKTKDALSQYGVHQLSMVNEGIYRHLEVEKVNDRNIARYCENLMSYFEYLTIHCKEAAAHFATLFSQQTFPEAVKFISIKCNLLVMMLISYIKNIK